MAINIGQRIMYQAKKALTERMLGQALGFLGNNPDRSTRYLIKAFEHTASDDKKTMDVIHDWLEEGKPGREFLGRILKNTHPNVRRRFIARLVVSVFFGDRVKDERCAPPAVMLISPSMRCNYRCQGCYAGSYERKDDMKPEVFDWLLSEAEDIGVKGEGAI